MTDERRERWRQRLEQVGNLAAAVSLGLLIGCLLALSKSPLVRDVTLGLVALLAAFLGLSGNQEVGKPVRVLGLSMGALGGVCLGLWLRNHDVLSPAESLTRMTPDRLNAIFGEPDGERLWLINQLGEIPPGTLGRPFAVAPAASEEAPAPAAPAPPPAARPQGSSLVGKEGGASAASCGALVEQLSAQSRTFEETKREYLQRSELRALPSLVESIGAKKPLEALQSLGQFACDLVSRAKEG